MLLLSRKKRVKDIIILFPKRKKMTHFKKLAIVFEKLFHFKDNLKSLIFIAWMIKIQIKALKESKTLQEVKF